MVTKIINGTLICGGKTVCEPLYFEDGKISFVGGDHRFDRTIDAAGDYVSAGFVDIHCHGGGGADFNLGDVDAVRTAVNTHLSFGTTTIFPTVTSANTELMEIFTAEMNTFFTNTAPNYGFEYSIETL